MNFDTAKAKIEWQKLINNEDSQVLDACVTCYACEEYCPVGNHPFYFIVEQQEKKGVLTASRAITKQYIGAGAPVGRFKTGEVKEKALSLCILPVLSRLSEGKLFKDVASSWVLGPEFFCNAAYLHFSKMSLIEDRLSNVIHNIEKQGIKELICLHDECYGTYTSLAPAYGIDVPFKTTHYFEYLYHRLKECMSDIKPVNVKVAYQRNCSARLVPETEKLREAIFDLISADMVKREYENENSLCCGGVLRMTKGYELTDDVQTRNIDDMANAGAEYCVFNCPACWDAMAEKVVQKGIKPIHMIDLCHLAIGEKPALEV
ncbi:heterodisulfide reductase-related iron-sulfur binding cluster [Thermodesulfobacteriota bacterium]